jgi:MFS family permease
MSETTDHAMRPGGPEGGPPNGADDEGERVGRRGWISLAVLVLPVLLISIDSTVLGFAVPAISEDLDPSSSQLLWIVDIYSFVLAGLLVTMGTLGDRIGRRRLLLIGTAGFGLASALAAYADTPAVLIAARALLGLAGATLMPSTLSLLRNIFTNRQQRTLAIAVWGSAFAGGAALGPIVGGWLLEHFWWGSIFLMNLPVMVVLLIIGRFLLPESKDPNPGRYDLPSAALSLGAMLPAVYGVKLLAEEGFSVTAFGAIAAGVLLGWMFVRRQLRLKDPMLGEHEPDGRVRAGGVPVLSDAVSAVGARTDAVVGGRGAAARVGVFGAGLAAGGSAGAEDDAGRDDLRRHAAGRTRLRGGGAARAGHRGRPADAGVRADREWHRDRRDDDQRRDPGGGAAGAGRGGVCDLRDRVRVGCGAGDGDSGECSHLGVPGRVGRRREGCSGGGAAAGRGDARRGGARG